MKNRLALLFSISMVSACGNAEIVAPESLAIVDTYPGNGSLVAADETTVVVAFSLDVDELTLARAVSLEESGAGAARPIALTLLGYDAGTFTGTFESEPLKADSTFLLTISASTLKAKSGSQLRSDVLRTFRTTPTQL
jgi:hypothetical protein